jgi:hypothetical protein
VSNFASGLPPKERGVQFAAGARLARAVTDEHSAGTQAIKLVLVEGRTIAD